MKAFALALMVATGVATAAAATERIAADKFDQWIDSLNQKGWRLVSISEPEQQALLIGPTLPGAKGLNITQVRYELMDGPYRSLVASDAINCATREIRRVGVTGYPQNNMAGAPVTASASLPELKPPSYSFQQGEVAYACGLATVEPIKVATTADPDPEPGERVVCFTENPIGSLVPQRYCAKKKDVDQARKEWRDALERVQREIPTVH